MMKPWCFNGSATVKDLSCGLCRWTQTLYQLQTFHHRHSSYWGTALRKYPTHQPTRCQNGHKTFSLTFRWVLQEELSKQCGTKHRRTTAMNHKRGSKTTASIKKARGRAAKRQHSAVWTDGLMVSLHRSLFCCCSAANKSSDTFRQTSSAATVRELRTTASSSSFLFLQPSVFSL